MSAWFFKRPGRAGGGWVCAAVWAALAPSALQAAHPRPFQETDYRQLIVGRDADPSKYLLFNIVSTGFTGGQIKWHYNDAGRPAALSSAAAMAAIQAGMRQWEAVCNIRFVYQGTTTAAPGAALANGSNDNLNTIGWHDPGNDYHAGSGGVYATGSGQLVEGDVWLSSRYAPDPATVVHELGHMMGIAHSDVANVIMSGPPHTEYSYASSLQADDIAACRHLYGAAVSPIAEPEFFVRQQYRDILGREGETAGVQSWVARLNHGTVTRAQLVERFFNSDEFQSRVAPVTRFYFAFFTRIPDMQGLQHWITQRLQGVPLSTIAERFAASAEFRMRYAHLSNGQFVDAVYHNVLGRAPDAQGRANWLNRLQTGMVTRGGMIAGFANSVEFIAKSRNRVRVSMLYYSLLRRSADVAGLNHWVSFLDQTGPFLSLIERFIQSAEYQERFMKSGYSGQLAIQPSAGLPGSALTPAGVQGGLPDLVLPAPSVQDLSVRGVDGATPDADVGPRVADAQNEWVYFLSRAGNLVEGEHNGHQHLYRMHTVTGTVQRMAQPAQSGVLANGDVLSFDLAADANRLVLHTQADNLESGTGLYIIDLLTLERRALLTAAHNGGEDPQATLPQIDAQGEAVRYAQADGQGQWRYYTMVLDGLEVLDIVEQAPPANGH